MTLSDCPNCSGYLHDPGIWFVNRPQLRRGRRSGKIFVMGCCAFSGASSCLYETEEEAVAAWDHYRVRASAGNARLAGMVAALDARNMRFRAAVEPAVAGKNMVSVQAELL